MEPRRQVLDQDAEAIVTINLKFLVKHDVNSYRLNSCASRPTIEMSDKTYMAITEHRSGDPHCNI